jgi:hypothetical protein
VETGTPVPDKDTTAGELDAVLRKVMLPVALVGVVGEYTAVKAVLCPALRVSGTGPKPIKEKPVPVTVPAEIVTLAPEAVRVPEILLVLPTFTLPKAIEVGFAVSCASGGATPAPASEIRVGLLVALLRKEICPEALPTTVGANRAV